MNLSRPFIRRPVMTTLVMIPLIFFGIFAYKHLPVSAIPFFEVATLEISTTYPGASPSDVARFISGPLERQFITMQDIQFVTSQNDYQTSTVLCQFHDGVNINVAAQDVQNAIQSAMGFLPRNLPSPPTYVKTNPSDTPIIYLVIHSDMIPPEDLYEWGYTFVGQQLGTVPGIANIMTFGYAYAVRMDIDPEALSSRNISWQDLSDAINAENPDQPTGKLYGKNWSIPAIVNEYIVDADKYNNLIIKYQDGEPVRVSDVGYAYKGLQNDKSSYRWYTKTKGAEDVVILAIMKQQGYNTVEVCDDIVALAEKLRTQLPAAVHLTIPYSQADFIKEAVNEVELTLLIAFLLVVLVIFVYLGKIRNSVIPLITLPITITGTFMVMYILGYNIDIMSLSALTLSIGFLIDDAIIVLENIVRYIEMGDPPYRAALKGSKQIIITVVSISLCLCAVFIPMIFLGGVVGKIFHEFGAVVIIAIIFSGFISLSLTPMLCSRFLPPASLDRKTKMERVSEKLNVGLLKVYKPALEWCLHHKFWVFAFCIGNIVCSVFLFKIMPKEFLPPNDLGVIEGFLMTQEGTSPQRQEQYIDEVTKICMAHPAVSSVARIDSYPTDNQSMFFMNLVDRKDRDSVWVVIDELRPQIQSLIGVRAFLKAFPLINLQVGNITAGKSNYQYLVQGFKGEEVFKYSAEMLEKLKLRPELAQVSSNLLDHSPELHVNVLRDAAHSYGGISALDIEKAFSLAYGETYISQINAWSDTYYVVLQTIERDDMDPSSLGQLYVGQGDDQVAINSVVDAKLETGPLEINNINTLASVTIAFDVGKGYSLSEAIEALDEVAQETLPANVFGSPAGSTAAFKKTFVQMTVLLFIAIFIIYIILGVLYENFIHPLTALSALPVAILGGLVTLLIFGQALSIYALIGLIMLVGIVMKNGILVVDFALEEMNDNGKEPYDAIVAACLIRFRPIIMTTFAAMMGAVPIAVGMGGTIAKGRAPLGIAIVGGLLFSQIVTLFVIPAFFLFICKMQQKAVDRWDIFREKHHLEEEEESPEK